MDDRVPLGDIPRLYVGDPQEGLKQIMRYLPGCTVKQGRAPNPVWTDTYTTDIFSSTGEFVGGVMYVASGNEEQKSQRIESWLKGLVQLASAKLLMPPVLFETQTIVGPPVNPVKLALAGARVTPETDAPGGNCSTCLGVARHQAWCPASTDAVVANKVQQPDAGDRLLAGVRARRNGTP